MANFYSFIDLVILSLIPLLVVSIGAMFSERGGVTNIALEGIMIFGAYIGVIILKFLEPAMANVPQLLFLIGMIVATVAGMALSLLHAYASVSLNADQIISATALNIFAPAFSIFLTMSLNLGEKVGSDKIPVSKSLFLIKEVPLLSKVPFIGDIFFKNVYLSLYIGIIILIASFFVLYKTRFGLRLRSCGENPHASDAAGVNIYKIRYTGVLISGALAGMGGYFLITNFYTLFDSTVAGYGFLAMAVMIFGNWKPFRIFFAALFFSFLKVLSKGVAFIPFLERLHINSLLFDMLPFVSTLIILVFMSKTNVAPKSIGVPYDKGTR